MKMYVLFEKHFTEDGEEIAVLGVYDTEQKAKEGKEERINSLKEEEEYIEEDFVFNIIEFPVNQAYWLDLGDWCQFF